jgi:hypothetical protein
LNNRKICMTICPSHIKSCDGTSMDPCCPHSFTSMPNNISLHYCPHAFSTTVGKRRGDGLTTTTMLSIVHNICIWKYGFMLFVYVDWKSPCRQIEPFKVRSTIAQYTIDCPSRFALGYLHTRLCITLVTCTTSLFTLASSDKLNVKYVICTRTWMNAMTICEHSYIILVLLLSQPVHHLWYIGHVYTKAIRLWVLRILVLSLVESLGGALYIMFENHVRSWSLLKIPLYTRGYMSRYLCIYMYSVLNICLM